MADRGKPPLRTSIWLFPDRPVSEIVAAATAAEAAGVDAFWLGDEGVAREPFTVLTAIGQATKSIGLGIAVTNPYLRHPALTASTAATVAEAIGRPLHLGFGPGGAASLAPVHMKPVAPVATLRRALRTARAVLAAEPGNGFEPGPYARPESRVNLWIGARGPRIAAMAGWEADGFFANLIKPLLGDILTRVRARRRLEIALCFPLIVDESILETIRPYLVYALLDAPPGTPEAAGMSHADAEAAAAALDAGLLAEAANLVSDEVVHNVAVVGDPDAAAAEFAAIAAAYDVDEISAAVWGSDLTGAVAAAASVLRSARDLSSST